MKKQKLCEEKSDEAKSNKSRQIIIDRSQIWKDEKIIIFTFIERSARDIMSILLNFHEKQVFTDEELKDEVLTIMFAVSM